MKIQTIQQAGAVIALIETDQPIITDLQSALDLMATVQYDTGSSLLVVPKAAFTEEFFDLRTRLAGEILQKFVTYGVKIAIVGDFSVYSSRALQSFIYESNQGNSVFFVSDTQQAVKKLATAK